MPWFTDNDEERYWKIRQASIISKMRRPYDPLDTLPQNKQAKSGHGLLKFLFLVGAALFMIYWFGH